MNPRHDASAKDREARELRTVEHLERSLRASAAARRLFYRTSLVFPAIAALLLTVLALYPILFQPSEKLTATYVSMVGAGLSFASVSFSAARANADRAGRTLRLATAGALLLRFAIAMAVALTLTSARERLVTVLGAGNVVDVPLRVMIASVTVAAIGMAFLGFRVLVLLLGPELEEDAAQRWRAMLTPSADEIATNH